MWLLLFPACLHYTRTPPPPPFDPSPIQALIAARSAREDALETAFALAQVAIAERPSERTPRALLTEILWWQAFPLPEGEAVPLLEDAWEAGIDCLELNPSFALTYASAGYHLQPQVLASLTPEDAGCAQAAARVGLTRIVEIGPGAALDLEEVARLAEASVALAPPPPTLEWAIAAAQLRLGAPVAPKSPTPVARLEALQAKQPGFLLFAWEIAGAAGAPWPPVEGAPGAPGEFARENGVLLAKEPPQRQLATWPAQR